MLEAAGKAGIPVITPLNPAANEYTIGLQGNLPIDGAALGQGLVKIMGDKGNMLEIQGIPGVPASDVVLKGADTVFKGCSGVKVAGRPVGQFVPSVGKAQTLQFLASHPGNVDGAVQVGGMATGAQSSRPSSRRAARSRRSPTPAPRRAPWPTGTRIRTSTRASPSDSRRRRWRRRPSTSRRACSPDEA